MRANKMRNLLSRVPSSIFLALALVGVVFAQDNASDAFPELYNSEKEAGEPLDAQAALAKMKLPKGFTATVFAAEPDVMNPIAAATDALGRVWVAENFTYAERGVRFDMKLNDRVIVLEDSDGDGVSDRRTVFADDLKILTGITVGQGGVWLMAPPQLLYIPDANGDLVPDGPAQVKLDGFRTSLENYHNFANGLSFGPDGWLYGRCGASGPGEMGLPGSTDEQRVPIRGGMWRYHPERKVVEALVQGTTNPWGNDWNQYGDLFFINTVNGHFWQCIPGAHFVRPHTLDQNPHSYELIDMHADHWHFDTGKSWTASRNGAANDFGGGHAHIGMMIYQESVWPNEYRGKVMTVNMHGRRVNVESLKRQGSGYTASHEPDILLSDDAWFRGMELLPLPDGNVLLVDWSDIGECHEHSGVHRTSGRIYKISCSAAGKNFNPLAVDETRGNAIALVTMQRNASEWAARRARDLLGQLCRDPHTEPTTLKTAESAAEQMLKSSNLSVGKRLRGLWSLVAMNRINNETLNYLRTQSDENMRAWGVRLTVDGMYLDTAYGLRPANPGKPIDSADYQSLVQMAQNETSSKVRLELASALQRLPLEQRGNLAEGLVTHEADALDHNLPLMVWYGLIPLGENHAADLLSVFEKCTWAKTRQLIARRIADGMKKNRSAFEELYEIADSKPTVIKRDVVLGTARALAGWVRELEPDRWSSVTATLKADAMQDKELATALQYLSVLFGDGQTMDRLKAIAADDKASLELRKSALQSLVDAKAFGTEDLCRSLLNKRFLNLVAAKGLANSERPDVSGLILKNYRRFHPSERSQVVSLLASRASWAENLLHAIQRNQILREELSAYQARQIASHEKPRLSQLLADTWGRVRASSAERKELKAKLKTQLTESALAEADKSAGRELFTKSCAKCHTLFGAGGKLGPDLTGAQRSNLDYLLDNIVDPSAVVTKEFRATLLRTEDDRVITGLVTEENANVVTIATQDEVHRIAREEIAQMKLSENSTMPDGLLDQMTAEQIRDLFAYLQSTQQVE